MYFFDQEIGSYYYGDGHPMKPHRLRMTHNLLLAYDLYQKLEVYRPHPAHEQEMLKFHAADYVDFIKRVSPHNSKDYLHQLQKFNLGPYTDCPIFDGIWAYNQKLTGGSIDGAQRLNNGQCDIAINWAGGLHHAKKSEASGFCYINDIVLAILELLKYHARVLYIDIDIHHGDGVEEAFYTTDRVMTASFHKFGDFFPGSGALKDTGVSLGKNYSVNFPMQDGIDDKTYLNSFKPIISKIMETFRPGAIVLQCGADSLTGDRLGCFNLTSKGHGECVRFVKSLGVPLLVLGGGGYNIRNVARCWAYETSVLLDTEVSNNIPYHNLIGYYAPDFKLHLEPQNVPNHNPRERMEQITNKILANLQELDCAPSVQMHQVPPDFFLMDKFGDEGMDPDVRVAEEEQDAIVQKNNAFYNGDKDNDNSTSAKLTGDNFTTHNGL